MIQDPPDGSADKADLIADQPRFVRELQEAIDKGDLLLHYQPILDLHTYEMGDTEALLRLPCNGEWLYPNGSGRRGQPDAATR